MSDDRSAKRSRLKTRSLFSFQSWCTLRGLLNRTPTIGKSPQRLRQHSFRRICSNLSLQPLSHAQLLERSFDPVNSESRNAFHNTDHRDQGACPFPDWLRSQPELTASGGLNGCCNSLSPYL
ncbi:hypothetical protein K443DRAFT_597582 [Laccaria amethystina LaAM-08-1]|uniref:Unplaced genomic scaffold K443scaffold_85, whole genome shotgun sequence n=1 Tax=Laccaria amethystina LaAM-08-1 TaxID=1095629 RepID=A0A0C9XXV5_9AGAR|nr:hypothetical protein K443DRAFT_597582 [Laccaria amethystina LaAM-08-1]